MLMISNKAKTPSLCKEKWYRLVCCLVAVTPHGCKDRTTKNGKEATSKIFFKFSDALGDSFGIHLSSAFEIILSNIFRLFANFVL